MPRAGTTSVTVWPRIASRSAYVRIARTPPAMRRCGQRTVTLSSDRHRHRPRVPVGRRIEDDVDAPDLAAAERLVERGGELARLTHQSAASAERLGQDVEARVRQRRGDGTVGAVERQLRVTDLPPAAVVADHAHERQ